MDRGQAKDRESSEQLVGSWRLVSFEHALRSGEVLKPYGDSPSGSILYHAGGHMSAQVSVGSPTRFASEEPDRASAEEAMEAWRTYFGYWGTYRVYAEKRVVVHRVEGCSFPNWIGTDQIRHFRLDGADRLILETQSYSGHFTVIWQREFDCGNCES